MNTSQHTPTPWEVHEHLHADGEFWCSIGHNGRGPITDIVGAEGNLAKYWIPTAGMKFLITPVEEQRANAAFIVRACNSHEALVTALEAYIAAVHGEGTLQERLQAEPRAQAALTLAKG